MSWRNDPDLGAIPTVGTGSVDIARRSHCGQAVRFESADNVDALIAFIGDDTLVNFERKLYQRSAEGQLTLVRQFNEVTGSVVVVKPPAGDWFVITEAELNREFAIVVNVDQRTDSEREADENAALGRAQIAAAKATKKPVAKKTPAKKAAPKKKA